MMSTRRTLDPRGVGEREAAATEEDDAAGHDLNVTLGRQPAEHAVPEPRDGRDGICAEMCMRAGKKESPVAEGSKMKTAVE